MQISKKAEYAILMLAHLSAQDEGKPVPIRKIAGARGLPENLMPQISSILRKEGWVRGKPGPGGGIILIADPSEITVCQVVEAVEGPIAINSCLLGNNECPNDDNCPLHEVWARAQSQLVDVMQDVTVQQLGERLMNTSSE